MAKNDKVHESQDGIYTAAADKEFRNVVIRGIPEYVHKAIRIQAAENNTSFNAEVLTILQEEYWRIAGDWTE